MFIYFGIIQFIQQAVTTHMSSDIHVNKADVIHAYNRCHPPLKEQTLSLNTVHATRTNLKTVVLGGIGQEKKDK